jgi:hypothetical protein
MAKLVTAIFKTRSNAVMALEDLIHHGFSQDDISLLMSETTRGREFMVTEATRSPEGLAAGAAVGGVLGAITLGLTSVGLIAAPGLGVFAVGQWLSMLLGFGAGALGGGLIGGLIGLGIPKHQAEFYKSEIEKGGILLGIYCLDDKRVHEAQRLLEANGGLHVRTEPVKDTKEELKRAG